MSEGVNRRHFIAGGAAASAGVLLDASVAGAHTEPDAKHGKKKTTKPRPRNVDVVVIGAGLAGISAARAVAAAGKSVALLEARDRVGGRTLNHSLPGTDAVVEVGGEFVGPTQDYTLELAQQMGVDTYNAYLPLDSVYINSQGQRSTYTGDLPSAGVDGIVDLAVLVNKLDNMASALTASGHLADPWNWSEAIGYDYQSAYTFVIENMPDPTTANELVDLFFDSAYGATSAEVSMLYVISQVAGFGNAQNVGTIERGISSEGGAQNSRFVGGSQEISIRAAATLGKALTLNAPVRSITQKGNQATVTSDAGTWTCKRVIVATPPQLAAAINYDPLMPPTLDAMRRRMTLGTLMKIHAVYPEPFWREDPGVWMGLKIGGCTPEMFDNTPPEGTPGVLMGFHGGRAWAQYANNPAGRKQAALECFAEVFGERALNPIDYFEQDWTAEEWSRGCPVSVVAPGVVTEFLPNLIAPFGLVHWAGTETAPYWNGYMSGAIESGLRAAQEVVSEL